MSQSDAFGALVVEYLSCRRQFLVDKYPQLKLLNPGLNIVVRHGDNIDPLLFARYDYGGEARREIKNKNAEEILDYLKELNDIGEVALKADLYMWQESYPKDKDVKDYHPYDPLQNHR